MALPAQLPAVGRKGQGSTECSLQMRRPTLADVHVTASGITVTYDPVSLRAALVSFFFRYKKQCYQLQICQFAGYS